VAAQFRHASVVRPALTGAFPNLKNATWRIKSPSDDTYQCIAWAACRTDRKWWPVDHPEFYWPPKSPVIVAPPLPLLWFTPVDYMIQGFRTLGYQPCDSHEFEFGYQKVAIYENETGATHMARQHFLGRGWLSKLGNAEDIFHGKLTDIEGSTVAMAFQYGEVAQILKRSWWAALVRLCLFRCWWTAFRHWLYRMAHPSWK